MSEMSPLLRLIIWLTRLTLMVIAALLVLLGGFFIGLHRDGFAGADWAVLALMTFLTVFAIYLARGLGRALHDDDEKA